MDDKKNHWEKVYREKLPTEVSWFSENPAVSLEMISRAAIQPNESVIDVGGGASQLVDHLLELGYLDITVLDISSEALAHSKKRLSNTAEKVHWAESDITEFKPIKKFALWHDRAVFHFLTNHEDREKYKAVLRNSLSTGGHVIIATFAMDGPEKCSGLPVCRYNASTIQRELGPDFTLIGETSETHRTPWGSEQKFCYFLLIKN